MDDYSDRLCDEDSHESSHEYLEYSAVRVFEKFCKEMGLRLVNEDGVECNFKTVVGLMDKINYYQAFGDTKPYDRSFGDKRVCLCGHIYYRHFDTYEEMSPVGCKYCMCRKFTEAPMAKLRKVISGAQTGSDLSGLYAAKKCGLETGGWMPKGFINEKGNMPCLVREFCVQEHSSSKYAPRTYTNVKDSDATLRLATNFSTPGERCTLKAIQQYNKPYMDVQVEVAPNLEDWTSEPHTEEVVNWIRNNQIEILNIAGNRESTAPGLQKFVAKFLIQVFTNLKEGN